MGLALTTLLLGLALWLSPRVLRGSRGLLALPLNDHLADVVLADEFLDLFAVHLLMLVREGVLVRRQVDDDVLLAGLRVFPEADGQLGHGSVLLLRLLGRL